VIGWLVTAKHWFVFAAYPLLVAFSFAFRTVQALIYALVGLLFAQLLNVKLDYKTLLRLTAVALTPVLVLDLILEFVPFHLPLWTLLGIGVSLGYLFFAVKANSEPETPGPDGVNWSPQNS
jgi:hypothetical protein